MTDNFNMKKFLAENKLGPYAKARLNEDAVDMLKKGIRENDYFDKRNSDLKNVNRTISNKMGSKADYINGVEDDEEEREEAMALKLKGYYQILDAGMNEWNDDYQYMGKVAGGSSAGEVGEHMFVYPDAPGSFTFVSIPDTDLDTMVKPSMSEGKEKVNEDLALVGTIALGVVGGLAGLYVLVKTTKFLGYVAGQGLMALRNKLQSSAKNAARGRRKEFIMGIVKKFEGDTELQSMYAALPPYSSKTKNERNNQMRKIAEYIKLKLTPEEMDYFNDISSMLRTGDITEKVNEVLEPHVYERMYNLSNINAQQAMIRAAEILMRDLTAEGFEVPEIREFFTQLIANDI